MITENLSTLKINKLTQEQYNRALESGNINSNELYLTPDENYVKTVNGVSPDENGNVIVDVIDEEQIDNRVALALGGFETGKQTIYVYTLSIDQFAGSISTNTVAVYPDIDTWASANINWTYSAMLKPTSITNQYEVVKAVVMPVEVVQAEKGSDYTPTSDDFKALFSSDYIEGYIFIAAHGYAENASAWKMERSKGVIVKISGVDFTNQTCTNAVAYIMTPDLSGIDLAVVEGKSAYEIAVEHGFEGSEAEWLLSLEAVDGYTPIRGTDYWTDADKGEINTDNINFISIELAKRGQLKPEFANSIEECTDTTKLYVLPDGYIYAYMLTEAVSQGGGNQADNSSADWVEDSTFDSSNSVVSQSGRCVTNYISCVVGDKIRLKNLSFPADGSGRIVFYDANKNVLGGIDTNLAIQYGAIIAGSDAAYDYYSNVGATEYDGEPIESLANTAYIRMTLIPSSDGEPIITVNEAIVEDTAGSDTAYTNLAEPLSDNITDSTKWVNGYRISSSAITTSSGTGKTTCNPIRRKDGTAIQNGDVVRIKGVSFVAYTDRVGLFKGDGTAFVAADYVSNLPQGDFGYSLDGDVHTFTILATYSDMEFFRCAFDTPTNPEDVIITVNEEIVEDTITDDTTVKVYAWANTGHAFVPADYEDRIIDLEDKADEFTNDINSLKEQVVNLEDGKSSSVPEYWQEAITVAKNKIIEKQVLGGVNSVNFVWTTDIHASASLDERGKRFGIVAKAIMDESDIPLFISTGDLMSQSSHASTEGIYNELALVKEWLSPIPYNQQALIMGNHDGAWGDSTSGYYYKQLPLEVMYNLIYRKQAMDYRRVSGDNGTYYYLDNESQKMRFVFLNTHNTPSYEENEDGTAVYDRFHADCLGQAQLDWLINTALKVPDGYTICLFMHAPYVGDYSQLIAIVDAFNSTSNRTVSRTHTDTEYSWRSSTINGDFSAVNGVIAGVFAGHTHESEMRYTGNNPMYSTCPLITMANSLGGEVRDGTTRTEGTDTEFAIDIVTVDTANRKIYMTRLGAGSDREVSY